MSNAQVTRLFSSGNTIGAVVYGSLAVLLVFGTLTCSAQSSTAEFDSANKLYEQGKFGEAAAAYEKMARAGRVSEPIYFNWGNALFKAGQVGRAIAAYQQASRIAPRDPDVRANLQFARNQVQGPTLPPGRVSRWLGKLSLNEWTWLAAGAVWAWLLMLTAAQWRPALRASFKGYTASLGVVAAVLCALFGAAYHADRYAQKAIVSAPEAVARQAPVEESQTAFTLHDGAELQVLDQKDQWLQVRADARRTGWVRKDNVLISPAS